MKKLFIDLKKERVRHAIISIVKILRKAKPDIVLSTLGHLNLLIAFFSGSQAENNVTAPPKLHPVIEILSLFIYMSVGSKFVKHIQYVY